VLTSAAPYRLVAAALALALTACTPAAPTQAPSSSQEPVTLRLLMSAGEPAQSSVRALADRFQAATPSVRVEIEAVPFQEFYRQVSVSLASGDPADILWPDPSFVRGYVANDALLPLCCGTGDDAITAEELPDFDESLVRSVSVDGKTYMGLVPNSGSLLYYNKELFDAVGATPPSTAETAWTWPQAIEAMLKVKKEEGGQVAVWGSTFRTNPPNQYEGMLFPRSMGEKGSPTFKGISDDGLTVSGYMDTPEAIQGFQVLQDLFVKHKLIPTTNIPDCFETARCATKIAPADTAALLTKQFPNLKWGVAPLPYLKTPIVHTGSQSYVVAAKTKHPKEAKAFVRFAVSKEQALIQAQDTFRPPARKSVAELFAASASKEPAMLLNLDTIGKWGQARPATAGFSEYNTVTAKMFADLANGAPVEERVTQAAKEVDAQLAKYKK
jgi:fructooligosaccharide transport system substrate-binding protein